MNREQYRAQARYCMTVLTLCAKAIELLAIKTKDLYSKAGYTWDADVSFLSKDIAKHQKAMLRDVEYLEQIVLEHGVTIQGRTDMQSIYDAWARDGYKMARFGCMLFNVNLEEDEKLEEAEEFLMNLSESPHINKDIISNLRLNEDKRPNTGGDSSAENK